MCYEIFSVGLTMKAPSSDYNHVQTVKKKVPPLLFRPNLRPITAQKPIEEIDAVHVCVIQGNFFWEFNGNFLFVFQRISTDSLKLKRSCPVWYCCNHAVVISSSQHNIPITTIIKFTSLFRLNFLIAHEWGLFRPVISNGTYCFETLACQ